MKFHSARQAWHDAFDSPTQQSDYAAILGNQIVSRRSPKHYIDEIRDENGKITARMPRQAVYAVETRVGKGSNGRIMDACEKGLIQDAIAQLRKTDKLAYCWGMAAYAPPANRFRERAHLLHYMMERFSNWGAPNDPSKVSQLALFCIHSCALRDVNGRSIDLRQARQLLRCDKGQWDKYWKNIWVRLERLLDSLPSRALVPVDEVVQNYQERITKND